MAYLKAREKQETRLFSYQVYMSDALQNAVQRKYLTKRWCETLDIGPKDDRTGDEIAADFILRAGLHFKGGGPE